jgi:nifR3 family TIM-barrel protein
MSETNLDFRRLEVNIGRVKLKNPVVAAPMAGVTDRAFRILAQRAGCALVCTEMINAQALIHKNAKTWQLLNSPEEKWPVSVQIFGNNPEAMARAAEIVAKNQAAIIDINMGCPTPKIVKNGEGAALMRNPALAADITRAVVQAVDLPVTVKIRKGWDESMVNAVDVAMAVEEAGAGAITVHGRTRDQFYSGYADWNIIREVKQNVSIPVIGNGDIFEPEDASRMISETGCDAVMIGRASLGNPWIFSRTIEYLRSGNAPSPPDNREKMSMALNHLELMIEDKGEAALWEMRKHAAWYTRGMPSAARLREQVNRTKSLGELRGLLKDFIN